MLKYLFPSKSYKIPISDKFGTSGSQIDKFYSQSGENFTEFDKIYNRFSKILNHVHLLSNSI